MPRIKTTARMHWSLIDVNTANFIGNPGDNVENPVDLEEEPAEESSEEEYFDIDEYTAEYQQQVVDWRNARHQAHHVEHTIDSRYPDIVWVKQYNIHGDCIKSYCEVIPSREALLLANAERQ